MQARKHVLCLTTAVALVLILVVQTAAQGGPPPPPTNILYGFITNNRTLTYANPGPDYFVPGDLVVNAGATLTIEPGVILHFTAGADTLGGGDFPTLTELTVRGTLIADAASGDMIQMVAADPGSSKWGQVKIEGGTATFHRVAFDRASIAVNCNSGGGSIRNCEVTGSGTGFQLNGAVWQVQECTLAGTGSGYGMLINSLVNTAAADSTDPRPSVVSGFSSGVQLLPGATAKHIVAHHNGTGFESSGNGVSVVYCTAVGNSSGMQLTYDSKILCSISALNGQYGIYTSGACPPVADYLDSWSNSTNYYANCGGPNRASFNPFFVNPGLLDFRLSSGSIFKTYGPWGAEIGAYGPGPGNPTPARTTTWGRVKANYR